MDISNIRYVIFDTFGTVFDWHRTVVREGKRLSEKYNFYDVDWGIFANEWRIDGYLKVTQEIAEGKREWEPVNTMHMRKLKQLLQQFRFPKISEEDLNDFNMLWSRLMLWPDVIDGLTRIKKRYMIGPFSNGDFPLIISLSKNANLPWDFITTADMFKKFKPNRDIYLDEIKLLGASPDEVLLVACHPIDLDGGKSAGLHTVYVHRPFEYGTESENESHYTSKYPFDLEVSDFVELATLLGV